MVLDRQRRLLDFVIVPLARGLRPLSPNQLTLVGLLFAAAAAAAFRFATPETETSDNLLLVGAVLVFLHGLLDLLDGVVARMFGKETPLGDFLDHVVDRVSDILLLSAVAFSPWGDVRAGLVAIAATLLVSYLGTQAQAVGAGRMYTGFVARADRLVVLMIAPLVDHVLAVQGRVIDAYPGMPHHALGWALWYIAIGGLVTALERFGRIYLYLRRRARA